MIKITNNCEELEQQEALNTFDLPKDDLFNLMWASFYKQNLAQNQRISSAALKGFCRMVVEAINKQTL